MERHIRAIRFGTGLSPDHPPPEGSSAFLAELTAPDRGSDRFPIPGWAARMVMIRTFVDARAARRKAPDDPALAEAFRAARRALNRQYAADVAHTLARAATAEIGFRDRLTWFWADHFSVSDGPGHLRRSVAAYHEEAIRPYMAGTFADLLHAAVTHPAMLVYLDQMRSIGPNSPQGRRGGGLNENLAREVLELHSLGVGGPYTQQDVRQLAELLTGLSVDRAGAARFNRNFVEPGAETVLGQRYGGDRPNRHDIRAVLDALAVHPSTARHVSRKLAVHFVADRPPEDLVSAMQGAWLASGSDLGAVYGAMLRHPTAQDPKFHKVRRPLDLIAAAARATQRGPALAEAGQRVLRDFVLAPLTAMGQPWLRPPGPQGWPEEPEAWITPQGLAARLDWAQAVGAAIDHDPRTFLSVALGPLASPHTNFAVKAAEDRAAGIALVLASPEFQRR